MADQNVQAAQDAQDPMRDQRQGRPDEKPYPPASGPLAPFEGWLYDMLVVKVPYQIPTAAKEWIVRYGPWITVAVAVLLALATIPALFAALALTGYVSTFGVAAGATVGIMPMLYLAIAILVIQLIVMFISVPMLLKRQRKGWLLVFYSVLISFAYSVVNAFSYGYFGLSTIIMGLIGAAIGFYVLFQIRSYYTR